MRIIFLTTVLFLSLLLSGCLSSYTYHDVIGATDKKGHYIPKKIAIFADQEHGFECTTSTLINDYFIFGLGSFIPYIPIELPFMEKRGSYFACSSPNANATQSLQLEYRLDDALNYTIIDCANPPNFKVDSVTLYDKTTIIYDCIFFIRYKQKMEVRIKYPKDDRWHYRYYKTNGHYSRYDFAFIMGVGSKNYDIPDPHYHREVSLEEIRRSWETRTDKEKHHAFEPPIDSKIKIPNISEIDCEYTAFCF